MCGKFTQKGPQTSWREFHALLGMNFKAGDASVPDEPVETLRPMRFAHIFRLDASGAREQVRMRWGFSSLHARTPNKPDHIHARAETIDSKPTFRDAFRARRGILMAATFNEAEELTPTKTLQYVVAPRDGKSVAIAVLWEAWENPEQGELLTFVMVTTPPNALIATITDRMPAVLAPEHWTAWLGETGATAEELKAMLKPMEGADWDMAPEKKTAPPPKPPKAPSAQGELF